jgi:hypothetical protein
MQRLMRFLWYAESTRHVVEQNRAHGILPKTHFCTVAISVHKFAILAPDVLALPSRSHNRAFFAVADGCGISGAFYAQRVLKAGPSWRNVSTDISAL